jgi:hypothetical protein
LWQNQALFNGQQSRSMFASLCSVVGVVNHWYFQFS